MFIICNLCWSICELQQRAKQSSSKNVLQHIETELFSFNMTKVHGRILLAFNCDDSSNRIWLNRRQSIWKSLWLINDINDASDSSCFIPDFSFSPPSRFFPLSDFIWISQPIVSEHVINIKTETIRRWWKKNHNHLDTNTSNRNKREKKTPHDQSSHALYFSDVQEGWCNSFWKSSLLLCNLFFHYLYTYKLHSFNLCDLKRIKLISLPVY